MSHQPTDRGHSNSLTFLRVLCAMVVVGGHSFVLSGYDDPVTREQISARDVAVQCFFVLSGYLIYKSLSGNASMWRFGVHRVFRIFPALWCYLALTVFVVTPWIIALDIQGPFSYWAALNQEPKSALHYLNCNYLAQAAEFEIGALFGQNPLPRQVNGSLWSIRFELIFYMMAAGTVAARRLPKLWTVVGGLIAVTLAYMNNSTTAAIIALGMFWRLVVKPGHGVTALLILLYTCTALRAAFGNWGWGIPVDILVMLRPVFPFLFRDLWQTYGLAFLGGMLIWRYHASIRWNPVLFSTAIVALIFGAASGYWNLLMPFALPYAVLYLGFRLPFQAVDRLGDFSYGIYIYSFPIQQLLTAAGMHRYGIAVYLLLSLLLSVAAGALSWFAIEKPALQLGRRIGRWRLSNRPQQDSPTKELSPQGHG